MSLFRRAEDATRPAPLSDAALERYRYAIAELCALGWPHVTAAQLATPAAQDEPGSLLMFNEGTFSVTSRTQYLTDRFDIEAARWCGRHDIEIAIP